VREEYQNKGIYTKLFYYLIDLARKNGIQGFTGTILAENKPMLSVLNKIEPDIQIECHQGVYDIMLWFKRKSINSDEKLQHNLVKPENGKSLRQARADNCHAELVEE